MANLELRGYLTTGKFQVNDYTIEIERTNAGMLMRITDGDGNVQQAIVQDGEPGMTAAEVAAVKSLYDQLTEAFPEWQDNETSRQTAEAARNLAENGPAVKEEPESDEDKAQYRTGLYQLMKDMYENYYSKIDENMQAIDDAKNAAIEAKDLAEVAARQVANTVSNNFASALYYYEGDTVSFDELIDSSSTEALYGTASNSTNFYGYTSAGRTSLVISVPLAKRLDYITSVDCTSFIAWIANSGGYGLASSFTAAGGQNYTSIVSGINIDRVQNCLVVGFIWPSGFHFVNNEPVTVRVSAKSATDPAIRFVLHGAQRPVEETVTTTSEVMEG